CPLGTCCPPGPKAAERSQLVSNLVVKRLAAEPVEPASGQMCSLTWSARLNKVQWLLQNFR
nr:hypothetical protein [Tanacetum cinerariifolium]